MRRLLPRPKQQISFLLFVAIFLISGSAYLYYKDEKKFALHDANATLRAISVLKVNELNQWKRERMSEARFFTAEIPYSVYVREIKEGNKIAEDRMRTHLLRIMSDGRYDNIYIMDLSGKISFSVYKDTTHDESILKYTNEAFRTRSIITRDFYYCDIHKKIHYEIFSPVIDKYNDVNGVLVFKVEPDDFLFPLIEHWPMPDESAESYIVRREGDSIRYISRLKFADNHLLNITRSISDTLNNAVRAALGHDGIHEGFDYRGKRVISDIRHIEGTPWFMVSEVDSREVFKELTKKAVLISLLSLFFILFTGTIIMWIYKARQRRVKEELQIKDFELNISRNELVTTLLNIEDGVIITDANDVVTNMNHVAQMLTGVNMDEGKGLKINDICLIEKESDVYENLYPVDNSDDYVIVSKTGNIVPVSFRISEIKDRTNVRTGSVMVIRDETDERVQRKITDARLNLYLFSVTHSLNATLRRMLDIFCYFIKSPAGFINIMSKSGSDVSINEWSSGSVKVFPKTIQNGDDVTLIESTIWRNSVENRDGVIFNNSDCEIDPSKKEYIYRCLSVPVIRGDRVVAVVVLVNKLTDYTSKEAETLTYLADLFWEIIENRRISEILRDSEERYRLLLDNSLDAVFLTKPDGTILSANMSACKMLDLTEEEICRLGRRGIVDESDPRLQILLDERVKMGFAKGEITFLKSDGSPIPVELSSALFRNTKGEILSSMVVRDISERLRLQESLRETEETIRLLFDSTAEGIYGINMDGKCIFCNRAALNMTGYESEEEVLGKNTHELFHHSHKDGTLLKESDCEVFKAFRKGGKTHHDDEVFWKKSGESFPVEYWSYSIKRDGKLLGSVVTFMDISERKRDEEGRQIIYDIARNAIICNDSNELYTLVKRELGKIMDSSGLYIAFYDNDNDLLKVIKSSTRMTSSPEWRAEQTLSGYVVKNRETLLLRGEDFDKFVKERKIRLAPRPAVCWLGVPLTEKGEAVGIVAMRSYINPYAFGEREARILETVAQEISGALEKQRIISDLMIAKNKAEESDRLKSSFLANISHEIRTPMNGILGFVELLASDGLADADRKQYLEIVRQSAFRLLGTINDIVEVSKIESKQVIYSPSKVDLVDVIDYFHIIFKRRYEEKGLEFRMGNHVSGRDALIVTDRIKLDGILTNILTNALKFTEKGFVEFGSSVSGDFIEFYIKDSGKGIPEGMLNAVFERFVQVDADISSPYEGSGLGLSIVKAYIEVMGGKVWVTSVVGEGSTFYFTLPRN